MHERPLYQLRPSCVNCCPQTRAMQGGMCTGMYTRRFEMSKECRPAGPKLWCCLHAPFLSP